MNDDDDKDKMVTIGYALAIHHAHAVAKERVASERAAIESQIGTVQFALEGVGALVALEAEERALAEYDVALEHMIGARGITDALHVVGAEARAPW